MYVSFTEFTLMNVLVGEGSGQKIFPCPRDPVLFPADNIGTGPFLGPFYMTVIFLLYFC